MYENKETFRVCKFLKKVVNVKVVFGTGIEHLPYLPGCGLNKKIYNVDDCLRSDYVELCQKI